VHGPQELAEPDGPGVVPVRRGHPLRHHRDCMPSGRAIRNARWPRS
jgi:hypothetical protein